MARQFHPARAQASTVYIIILNWNNASDTLQCLHSVSRLDYANLKVMVVDNGSTDDSVAIIQRAYPEVFVLRAGDNLGYAEGNNVGIKHAVEAGAGYFLLLNNDVLVHAETVTALAKAAEVNPDVGLLGPKIYHLEDPERLQSVGGLMTKYGQPFHRGMDEPDRGQYDVEEEVDFVSGCALMITKQAIERIGLLDHRFFMYQEELDWCYRAREAGLKILYVPTAKVWHRRPKNVEPGLARITYYMARNELLFLQKNRLGYLSIIAALLRDFRTLFSWTVRPKWRHRRRSRDALFWAIIDFFRCRFGKATYSVLSNL